MLGVKGFLLLSILVGVNCYMVVVLICISLITDGIWYIFMHVLDNGLPFVCVCVMLLLGPHFLKKEMYCLLK